MTINRITALLKDSFRKKDKDQFFFVYMFSVFCYPLSLSILLLLSFTFSLSKPNTLYFFVIQREPQQAIVVPRLILNFNHFRLGKRALVITKTPQKTLRIQTNKISLLVLADCQVLIKRIHTQKQIQRSLSLFSSEEKRASRILLVWEHTQPYCITASSSSFSSLYIYTLS